jgi:Gas vesicle protein G
VGLFTALLTLPVAPVRGVIWLSERVLDVATAEECNSSAVYEQLAEIEQATAAGELSAKESEDAEAELVARLMRARAQRQSEGP